MEKFKGVFIDTNEGTAKIAEFTEDDLRVNLKADFSPFIIPIKVKGVTDEINVFSICDISEQFKEEAKYAVPSVVYKENGETKPLTFKNVFIIAGEGEGYRSLTDKEVQKIMEQMTIFNGQICLLASELL